MLKSNEYLNSTNSSDFYYYKQYYIRNPKEIMILEKPHLDLKKQLDLKKCFVKKLIYDNENENGSSSDEADYDNKSVQEKRKWRQNIEASERIGKANYNNVNIKPTKQYIIKTKESNEYESESLLLYKSKSNAYFEMNPNRSEQNQNNSSSSETIISNQNNNKQTENNILVQVNKKNDEVKFGNVNSLRKIFLSSSNNNDPLQQQQQQRNKQLCSLKMQQQQPQQQQHELCSPSRQISSVDKRLSEVSNEAKMCLDGGANTTNNTNETFKSIKSALVELRADNDVLECMFNDIHTKMKDITNYFATSSLLRITEDNNEFVQYSNDSTNSQNDLNRNSRSFSIDENNPSLQI